MLIFLGILLCIALGWLIRWGIWLGCFFLDFFCDWAIIDWIVEHDTIMLVICSCLAPFLLIGEKKSSDNSGKTSNLASEPRENFDYLNNRKEFDCFVDASGAYRNFGDDFIDCEGNWCKWGTGFYDCDGNYIKWGNVYRDSSGAYRNFGDDFIDGSGNWVRHR